MGNFTLQEVYLDNAATTRCDARVAQVALEMMTREYGNPSSLHRKGLAAELRVAAARESLAAALGCDAEELVLTSGGTEANNLAILGAVRAHPRLGKTIVAVSAAHASVRAPLAYLEKQGYTVRTVDPLPDGNADADALLAAVDDDTVLFCCELVGSETGAVAPVADLCRVLRQKHPRLLIHCDAVQAFGKLRFAVRRLGADTLSVSAHKIMAPKGCGALYVRGGVRLQPLVYGGGQERDRRAGTENTAAICAFGFASELAQAGLEENYAHAERLREHLVNKIGNITGLCINSPANATPYICSLSAPGYKSEPMLHFLAERGVFVSSGSACARGAASPALLAMGLPGNRVDSALRVSFSPHSTIQEIDLFCDALREGMQRLTRSGV